MGGLLLTGRDRLSSAHQFPSIAVGNRQGFRRTLVGRRARLHALSQRVGHQGDATRLGGGLDVQAGEDTGHRLPVIAEKGHRPVEVGQKLGVLFSLPAVDLGVGGHVAPNARGQIAGQQAVGVGHAAREQHQVHGAEMHEAVQFGALGQARHRAEHPSLVAGAQGLDGQARCLGQLDPGDVVGVHTAFDAGGIEVRVVADVHGRWSSLGAWRIA